MAPSTTRDAVKRWTSNVSGLVTFCVDCQQIQDSVNDQVFLLYKNGALVTQFQKSNASQHVIFLEPCDVVAGDVLDFVIDSRDQQSADWTHVDVRIVAGDQADESTLFYYPLDEKSDLPIGLAGVGSPYDRRSRVADFSANDHHAVLQDMNRDAPSVAGAVDQARVFDGIDDAVVSEASDIGDGLTELTMSVWVNPSSREALEGFMGSTGSDHFGFTFSQSGSGLPLKFSAKGQAVIAPEGSIPDGEWTHVTGVWKSGVIHRLYINGEEVSRLDAAANGVADVDKWVLGSDRLIPNRFFNGAIDEARLINRALRDNEVRDLYRADGVMSGLIDEATYFNGITDFSLLDSESVQGATEITIAGWINPFTKQDNETVISSSGADFFGLLSSGFGEGFPIEFRAKSQRLTAPNYTCPTGQWNHVAGVWKSGAFQRLYINGVEVASSPTAQGGAIDIDQWILGNDRFNSGRSFHGLLEGLTILPQALEASDVASLYGNGLPAGSNGPQEMTGHLRWDYRLLALQDTTEDLMADPNYLAQPTRGREVGFLPASSTGILRNSDSASRLRGYLTAPETGEYFFWASGRSAIDLSLSPDDQKFTKQIIARLSPIDGTAIGVGSNWPNRWDSFVGQMSEPVFLQAGERYFIEALQTTRKEITSHASIAWARPNSIREPIPAEFLSAYVQEATDRDDDFLPDAWETQFGLDTSDNGAVDTARQGERGDYDNDGLMNREEYLAGTDPTDADTDGDGISDFDEVNAYKTDPTQSDVTPETLVHTVDLSAQFNPDTDWVSGINGGVRATSFRGTGTWNFTTPDHGHWIIQASARLRGNLRFEEELPVVVSINGNVVQRTAIAFRGTAPGTLRVLTPWLAAGNHEVSVFIDNHTTRRSLEVNSIQVLVPGGVDLDGSGLADWADAALQARSSKISNEQYSYISPAFIEGRTPSASLVDVTTISRSGDSNRDQRFTEQQMSNMLASFSGRLASYADRLQGSMRNVQINPTWYHHNEGRMEGTNAPLINGPGTQRWFTMLDLPPNEAIGYVAQQENLGTYHTGIVAWMPANVFTVDQLTIPVGSKLLIGAWIQDWDWRQVTLDIAGTVHTMPSAKTHIEHFTNPGTYTITATHEAGDTASMTVEVVGATMPSHLAVGEARFVSNELPGLDASLSLDINSEVPHSGLAASGTGSSTLLSGLRPGVYSAASRLSVADNGGRSTILSQTPTYVVGASDALRNGSDLYSPIGDGLVMIRSPYLVTNLPPGATLDAVIFAGGVTFTDGTTTKTLTAADFDENGVYTFEMIAPEERVGAPCHYTTIYDADGKKLWNSTN